MLKILCVKIPLKTTLILVGIWGTLKANWSDELHQNIKRGIHFWYSLAIRAFAYFFDLRIVCLSDLVVPVEGIEPTRDRSHLIYSQIRLLSGINRDISPWARKTSQDKLALRLRLELRHRITTATSSFQDYCLTKIRLIAAETCMRGYDPLLRAFPRKPD